MRTVTMLQGLDPSVSPDALRDALRGLHEVEPTAPAVCRLQGSPLRWTPVPTADLDEWLERIVVDERASPSEEPHLTVQRLLHAAPDSAPFRVVVRNGSHTWLVDHVLGDGSYVFRQAIVGLVKSAVNGRAATGLSYASAHRHPLLSATWNTFRSGPRWSTWRAAVDRWRTPFHAGAAARTRVPAGEARLRTVTRTGEPGGLEGLRQWRDAHSPDLSLATLTMAVARMALEAEQAVEPATDGVVMFDARRYLPRGSEVPGNFSAALRVTDPSCGDPRQLGDQVRRDMDLGLPVVSLLAASAAETLSPLLGGLGRDKGSGPVVLTHLGPLNVLRDLPWAAGAQSADMILAAAPSGLSGITVTLTEWRKRLNVTMTSDARFVDQDAVARAATRLVEDPCGVLRAPRAAA